MKKARTMRVQSVDLADAARSLRSVMDELLNQTHTQLSILSPGDAPVIVTCDPHALRQVLMNLVLNAEQALQGIEREGHISLQIRREGEFGVIDVTDNGPGIDPAMRERIFKPFQTSKADGHGIGLALVKRFADNFGGSVSVDSELGRWNDVPSETAVGAGRRTREPGIQRPWHPVAGPSTALEPVDQTKSL